MSTELRRRLIKCGASFFIMHLTQCTSLRNSTLFHDLYHVVCDRQLCADVVLSRMEPVVRKRKWLWIVQMLMPLPVSTCSAYAPRPESKNRLGLTVF